MYIHIILLLKMYSTGVIITLLIGGLTAAVASSDDDILCYLQKIESKYLQKIESKLDECCKKTGDAGTGNGGDKGDGSDKGDGGDAGDKPSRTRDPNSIGSTPIKTITGFNGPFNLYFTDDGTAYLTEYSGSKIRTLDSKGNTLKEASVPTNPLGIHVKDGVVYVAHVGNQIIKYSASDLSKTASFHSPNRPIGVAVDSNGNIYANEYNTGIVHVYNNGGSKIRTMQMAIDGDSLRAIRFDANENLYSSSLDPPTIYVSTKEGVNVKAIKVSGLRVLAEGPFVDDNGNIYVPDVKNGMVYILNSFGTVIKKFQSAAKGASDAVIAPDGTLWVVDYHGNAIYLY